MRQGFERVYPVNIPCTNHIKLRAQKCLHPTARIDDITQARGRYRNHLENLYLHSVDECGVVVPLQYLNRHLYKQDYDELRAAIGIVDPNDSKRLLPKPRLKQLLDANGYTVTENLRDRKGRYRTIEKREDV